MTRASISPAEQQRSPALVSLVGAGPGDPGLLTVRALDRLRAAEVVVYDRLVDPRLLDEAPACAERIYVGKQAQRHAVPQAEITALLVAHGQSGRRVVRLKGGDPFVFGRGAEEAEALAAAGVPFEIVPGVSSAVAVPAYAGIPVTHRAVASSFVVVTGHEDPARLGSRLDWAALARIDTVIFLMSVGNLPRISAELIAHGRAATTPSAAIAWGTWEQQRTITGTLATLPGLVVAAGLGAPATIVVGEVVGLRERLRWFGEDLD
jgi:uroporphyrin-III C-methyltransferase